MTTEPCGYAIFVIDSNVFNKHHLQDFSKSIEIGLMEFFVHLDDGSIECLSRKEFFKKFKFTGKDLGDGKKEIAKWPKIDQYSKIYPVTLERTV